MPRPRTEKIAALKQKLIARLQDGHHRPGQRFFSNRALAGQFGISYLTAHRLIGELEAEGWLERRAAAGTYTAGPVVKLKGVQLVFNARAQRAESFGARLLELLSRELESLRISFAVGWATERTAIAQEFLPVLWDCPHLVRPLAEARRFALLLNDRPPPGLTASLVDSVSTDDFSGGAAAAEILRRHRRLAVFAGPTSDARSQQRVAGFLSVAPGSRVLSAESWFAEDAAQVAPRIARGRWGGVFCCNDRLAEALVTACDAAGIKRPSVVGFDDAPISEQLDLTTVAIPWREITDGALEIVRRRLAGNHAAAAQLIYAPRVVFRASAKLPRSETTRRANARTKQP